MNDIALRNGNLPCGTSESQISGPDRQPITHTVREYHVFERFVDVSAVDDADALEQVGRMDPPKIDGWEWTEQSGIAEVVDRAFHELNGDEDE